MSYSDDAVKAKLSALNETQESIVTVAQWIMFHRRHADRTASLWLNRLQETNNVAKRLNLIYLANEVVQQSRARSKQDFLLAFEPLIADATAQAYKGASQDVQGKLRRVVEVWRQRQIFDLRIQEQAEQRLEEIDKQKGGKGVGEGGRRLGGSLFGGGGTAPELEAINKSQTAVTKAETGSRAPLNTANAEYTKMTDPETPIPSAPVRCAKLRGLVKDLRIAQSAVETSMKARSDLLASLESLVGSHRAKLAEDAETSSQLTVRIGTIELKAREVEDSIMLGQSETPTEGMDESTNGHSEPSRPETEGFTPPPPEVESFTPPPSDPTLTSDPAPLIGGDTPLERAYANPTGADIIQEEPPYLNEPAPAFRPPPPIDQQERAAAQAQDFLQSFLASAGQIRPASGEIPPSAANGTQGDPRLKRRKMSHKTNDIDEEIFGTGDVGGVDEDGISAMLGQ